MTNCPSGDKGWGSEPILFLFFFVLVRWLHNLGFRFCKAMAPACARVLDAVYTLSLVIYFLGVHLNRTKPVGRGAGNEKNSVGCLFLGRRGDI